MSSQRVEVTVDDIRQLEKSEQCSKIDGSPYIIVELQGSILLKEMIESVCTTVSTNVIAGVFPQAIKDCNVCYGLVQYNQSWLLFVSLMDGLLSSRFDKVGWINMWVRVLVGHDCRR
jgi:hypothetical protein